VTSNTYFISGLPRSGSTLLSAILAQNPRIHASMSSPVASLVQSLSQAMAARSQWSALINLEQRKRLLRSVFEAYHGEAVEGRIVFDTNRLWCARLPLLAELFPGFRVIACVRDPKWIINSFETIFRGNPLLSSRLFNGDQGQTVYSRVDALAAGDGTYGFAFRALKEAYFGELADRLILVDYEALTQDPRATLLNLYAELDLPSFDHDFDHVVFDGGDEFDAQFGLPGLHRVEPRVRAPNRRMLLPPELAMRFANQNFWNRPPVNGPEVSAILSKDVVHDAS
jgi:sulfotransferase